MIQTHHLTKTNDYCHADIPVSVLTLQKKFDQRLKQFPVYFYVSPNSLHFPQNSIFVTSLSVKHA